MASAWKSRSAFSGAESPDVRVEDFGIRGLDLAYALAEGCQTAILIDAVPRGDGPPGTLYVLEPQFDRADQIPPTLDAHSMDPVKVLRMAEAMGAKPGKFSSSVASRRGWILRKVKRRWD